MNNTKELRELTSSIEKLIELRCSPNTLKLLNAIALSTLLDEKRYNRFLITGFNAALALYDSSNMVWMGELEEVVSDPDNPRNWEEYQRYLQLIS